jgi:uncharacterized Zn finger protein
VDEDLLTEACARALVPEKVFRRGEAYCRQGAVLELARRGDVLHAVVAGSMDEPYHVRVTTRGDRIIACCTCPYADEWEGWCKHIVAVVLAKARRCMRVVEQPTVRALLGPLDREAMEHLLETLVEREPWLYEEVRAVLAINRSRAARAQPARRRQDAS